MIAFKEGAPEETLKCLQCKWLDKKSRGQSCRDRESIQATEKTDACADYESELYGVEQVRGTVKLGSRMVNVFKRTKKSGSIGLRIGDKVLVVNHSGDAFNVRCVSLNAGGMPEREEGELVFDSEVEVTDECVTVQPANQRSGVGDLLKVIPEYTIETLELDAVEETELISKVMEEASVNVEKIIARIVNRRARKKKWSQDATDSVMADVRKGIALRRKA